MSPTSQSCIHQRKKRTFRFYLAVLLARAARALLKLLGRQATHFPGEVALRVCPDFLARVDLPETLICVTGTNGKTTCSNMCADVLRRQGETLVHNQEGSNMPEGVIVALLGASSFWGRARCSYAVLEVDERGSYLILPYLRPQYLIITNLFRDSFRRNAHVEFITDFIRRAMPPETTMIVNADDMISNSLCPQNQKVYFGIDVQPGEREAHPTFVHDTILCPNCHQVMTHHFLRYHHIGRAYCPHCGLEAPEPDVTISHFDWAEDTIQIRAGSETFLLSRAVEKIVDLYNLVACIAVFWKMGWSVSQLKQAFDGLEADRSRHQVTVVGDKRIITVTCKDENPVANSRVFDFVSQDPSQKPFCFTTIIETETVIIIRIRIAGYTIAIMNI